jgi:hypothetical protein
MKRFLLGVVTMTFIAYGAICCVKAEAHDEILRVSDGASRSSLIIV